MISSRIYLLFAGLSPFLLLSPAIAKVPLSDSASGMTCGFHMAGTKAEWLRRGGDWTDANGVPYGDLAYAVESIRPTTTRQHIEWDVTMLVREWLAGQQPFGALLMRAIPGSPDGVINFASRENADSSAQPSLVIEWSDGTKTQLKPTADTSINCTTYKSLGSGAQFGVGGKERAVVVFPVTPDVKRTIKRAQLFLTTDKQWGRGADVGVFRLTPPWSLDNPVRSGLAAAYPGDKDIAYHPSVFFATGFEARKWQTEWSTYGKSSLAETVSARELNGFEPLQGKALRVRLVPDQNLGLDLRYDFAKLHGTEPEEAYFRYYLRFGENWKPTLDGGKLPGFAGTYNRGGWGMRKSDGTNGWSARGSFFRNSGAAPDMVGYAGVGSYVYHADIQGAESENIGWGMGPTGRLRLNQWYSIEQYVHMNDPGQSNGVLRAWIDGQLVFERADLRFRDIPALKIENLWFNVYHGGVAKPPHDMTLYLDNVVIAREYIGPLVD